MKKKLLVLAIIAVLCVSIFAVTLTACKKTVFTVTFDSDGGSEVASIEGTVETEPIPTKEGNNFIGWFIDGAESKIEFPYVPTANVTLKAKWEKQEDVPKPENKELTVSDVKNLISEAISANTVFDSKQNYAIQLGMSVSDIVVNYDIVVDPNNISKMQMCLSIKQDGENVCQIFVDDTNMYAVTENAKRRYSEVNMSELIEFADVNIDTTSSLAITVLQLAISMIFPNEGELIKNGNTYQINGNLNTIMSLLGIFGVKIPDSLSGLLNNLNIKLSADIKDKKDVSNVKVGLADINGVEIGITTIKISNDLPKIDMPSKSDADFTETYLLNFTLNGSVTLQNRQANYTVDNLVRYDYELRVDFNIMEAIRNCLEKDSKGKLKFSAANLFKTKDSKIFFDLSHTCSDECADFCSNKEGAARGSILSIAYSPADFKSENINIAVNIKNLLPKGLISTFVDLGSINIIAMFGEYVGLTLNPEAMIVNASISDGNSDSSSITASTDSSQFSIDTNYLGVVLDVLDLLSSVTLNQSEGFRMDVDDLISLADRFSLSLGANLGNILSMFFGDANILNIKVDDVFTGDESTANMNIYHRYMTIDSSIGEYKSFICDGNDFTPAVNFEWKTDAEGIVKFADESAYENDRLITMSADEIRQLLKGGIRYTYNKLDGEDGEAVANILKVSGLDYNLTDKPQRVMIVTDMVDGGALSGLLNLVTTIMPDLNISIPGAVVYADITVASVKSVELVQGSDVQNAYDEDKTYYYKDYLNPQFTAKLVYGDGTSKELTVDPTVMRNFSNYSDRNNAQIDRFGTFDMVYEAFGRTFVKTVTMANQIKDNINEIFLNVGDTYKIGMTMQNVVYIDKDNQEQTLSRLYGSEEKMSVEGQSGVIVEKSYSQGFFGQTFDGYKLIFDNSGVFEVNVIISGYQFNYKFTVTDATPQLPGYALNLNQAGPSTINGQVVRTDQLGNGLNATVKVESKGVDGSYELLENGVDYELYVSDEKVDTFFLDSFLIKPFEYQIKMLKYGKYTLKVTLNATDFDNAEITSIESEFDIVSLFAGYSITSEVVDNLAKDSQDGKLIKVSPVVETGKEISDLAIKFVVEVKIGDGEWTELTNKGSENSNDYDEVYMTETSFWGTTLYGLASADVIFSTDGNGENGAQYIRIQKVEIKNATTDVQYRISVIATSHDNEIIATTTGTINVA